MGIRLHILAKELGVESKELVARCRDRGIKVKTHLSAVPEPIAEVLRKEMMWRKEREKAAREAAAAAAAAAALAPPPTAAPRPSQERPRPGDQGRYQRPGGRPDQGRSFRPGTRPPPRPAPRPMAPPPPRPGEPHRDEFERPRRFAGSQRPEKAPESPAASEAAAKDRRLKGGKGREKSRERTDGAAEGVVWRPPKTEQFEDRQVIFRPRKRRGDRHGAFAVKHERPKSVDVELPISVRDLSSLTGIRANDVIRTLMLKGMLISINDSLTQEMLLEIAAGCDVEINVKKIRTLDEQVLDLGAPPDRPEDLLPRAPVVTILGHVDHGKTSLLDRIRRTNVTAQEFGGITQHIGAYSVQIHGNRLVFLDTPGHEAFTAMRARGANVTDIVVLVVAADDGVMPQTIESINHAKAANVPIVVALNKIDKGEANPMRVRQQLVEHGLASPDWGGQTEFIEVSALTGRGIEDLLEILILQAEVLELKANPNKPAVGTVLEAHLSEGTGVVATLLVRDGTLRLGDYLICGSAFGRVRIIHDDQGRDMEEAGPATPIEISGLDLVPEAGDTMQVVSDLQRAKNLVEERQRRRREEALAHRKHVTLETLFSHLAEAKVKEAKVIIKADVKGSVEVLAKALNDIATSEVRVNVLHSGVGAVAESDVLLADASDAVVIAFQVVAEERAASLAEEKGVEIRRYQIIYQVVDDMKKALEGLLEPEKREVTTGHLAVTNIFKSSKFGVILGGKVTDGRITRNDSVRLIRDGRIIYDGKVQSLRRVKEDVREVAIGFECGIRLVNFDDVKEGDTVEAYMIEKIARKL